MGFYSARALARVTLFRLFAVNVRGAASSATEALAFRPRNERAWRIISESAFAECISDATISRAKKPARDAIKLYPLRIATHRNDAISRRIADT
jgi:acyl-coenzyme A synthetase/AMP-(fatty) acid ligase